MTAPVDIERAVTIFPVGDLRRSLDYYTGVLGFTVDWEFHGIVAQVSRGPCPIMLVQGDQGHPGTWIWVGVSDADALHRELMDAGATIRQPPTNHSWALEIQVEDPDGNVLRFGSEPRPGPPWGLWKDMPGRLWP